MEILFKCVLFYSRAESQRDFETARGVLAERLIRMFAPGVPRCPIRVTSGFGTPEWMVVVEAALSACAARTWPEDEDVTVPMNQLRAAGMRWVQKVARWTPEPWRV